MKNLLLILLCLPMIGFGQEFNRNNYSGVYFGGPNPGGGDDDNYALVIYDSKIVITGFILGYPTHSRFFNYPNIPSENIFSNILISNDGVFTSDQGNGHFSIKEFKKEETRVLYIASPFNENSYSNYHYFEIVDASRWGIGLLPQTSLYKFKKEELLKIMIEKGIKQNKNNFQIIRNEIFARYGYDFREGGKMWDYFNKQSWYRKLKRINKGKTIKVECCSEIEKHNIRIIKQLESLS